MSTPNNNEVLSEFMDEFYKNQEKFKKLFENKFIIPPVFKAENKSEAVKYTMIPGTFKSCS